MKAAINHLFRNVEEMSNRMGNLMIDQGFAKGDAVALFMENRLEYIPIWMGMSKVGTMKLYSRE